MYVRSKISRHDIPRLADRLERRMSWPQIALAALSGIGMIIGIIGLVEAVGLAPRAPLVDSLDAGTLALLALAIYVPSGWGLAWALARGDQALALRRLPRTLAGGVLVFATMATAAQLMSSHGGTGSSQRSTRRSRSAGAARTGLAAAVCDVELAEAALGGDALDGPRTLDSPMLRGASMCTCSGPAGDLTLSVAATGRPGWWTDPTAAFPIAVASDARWFVRAIVRPGDGHEVDMAALQRVADRALASLPS